MDRVEKIREKLFNILAQTLVVPRYEPDKEWAYNAPYDIAYLLQQNDKLKEMLELWAKSFYCDGETKEKEGLKELRFNQFVEMWENFNRPA